MKNLLTILIIFAFATSAFATSTTQVQTSAAPNSGDTTTSRTPNSDDTTQTVEDANKKKAEEEAKKAKDKY